MQLYVISAARDLVSSFAWAESIPYVSQIITEVEEGTQWKTSIPAFLDTHHGLNKRFNMFLFAKCRNIITRKVHFGTSVCVILNEVSARYVGEFQSLFI